mgnify:CR=1 FL=1
MGMVLIGMSLGSAFGFCFYIGLWFGELHSSLPFLLLGIGVDDMYVIVQGISNLSDSDKKLPIPDRIGIAMKHAGVSITVTSVTDMAAFLIGSSSVSFFLYILYIRRKQNYHFLTCTCRFLQSFVLIVF